MIHHHAQLLIGPDHVALEATCKKIQHLLCANAGCGSCRTCTAIQERHHHSLTWLAPDPTYTRKQLVTVFEAVQFVLDPGVYHAIVFERVDLLTAATANSLLKLLEEPPDGYRFFLLAPRQEGILDTIVSRCLVETLLSSGSFEHPLVDSMTNKQSLAACMKVIEEGIAEQDIHYLLDAVCASWQDRYRDAVSKKNHNAAQQAHEVSTVMMQSYKHMPMPGSAKLFLKNLVMKIQLAL